MKRKGNLGDIFAMALILVLTLVLSVGSVSAAEPTIVDSGNCGKDGSNVTWTLDSNGLLTISGTGEMTDYCSPWYDQKESIKRVVIENGVTSIGGYAFSGCTGLTSVTIPDSVTSIGYYAFSGCTGLTSVTIGSGVTSIGEGAFSGCTGLKEVIYNAKAAADLTEYSHVFEGAGTAADGMKVVFGESVKEIPNDLFYDCAGLTSVTIPDSVTSIGDYAFYGCTGLTSVTIPDSVTSIGGWAFEGCTSLTSVTIGSNVTSIGDYAFRGCTGLKEVIYNAKAAECSEYNVFQNAGTAADGMKVVFGESVEKIPELIFEGCEGLTSLTIGSNVTSIGFKAFECSNLTEVNYNAKAITDSGCGADVFLCAGTSSSGIRAVIGNGVKKIPAGLFYETNIRSFVFTGNPPTVGTEGLGYAKAYAFYPGHNSEWTETVREACGSHLTWIGYCTEPVSSAACRIDQTAYLPNDTLNTQGLCMTLTHKDGCTETIFYDSGLLELGSCDMSTPGAKTIDVTYRGTTAQLKIYVHERKTQTLDKKGYPESSHNYENNLDKTYTYKAAGAVSLDVTFSAQTEVETNIDYIYVNGAQYTGTELAGKTLTISGDTLTICLVSDKSDSAYGFSIDSIVVTYMCHEYEDTVVPPTCTEQGYTLRSCPCGSEVKQNYVDALGHDMVTDAAVAPTCTKTGLTEGSHCSRCGAVLKAQAEIPALGHDYKNGTCTRCGDEDPNYKPAAPAAPAVKPDYLLTTGKPYLKWKAVDGAVKYYVYRGGSKSGTYQYIGTATKLNYTDTTAKPGYYYYYKVKAVNASGVKSSYSAAVTALCHCARPELNSAQYLSSSGKPYLSWGAVTGASKYYVYRAGSQNGTYKYIGSTTKTNYTDTTASAGYTYYYKVKAVSKVKTAANSAYSTVVKATCHCAKPVVKITTSSGKPKLTWNAVAGAGKYEVYRATSKNGTYTKMFTTTNRSYTNTNARAGTTYYYKVKAISRVRSAANSSYSVVKSIRAR